MHQYKREPLANHEVDSLVNACESLREKLMVFTLLDTGLRVSELANLTKQNIQWQEQRLVIHGKGGPSGKMSKVRVIPMTERVRVFIEQHYTINETFGISARQIQRIVRKVATRAGIAKPVTPHVLRHTFAVICLKRGISTRVLQYFLGHDRITTTEIYMNLSPEDAIREFQSKWRESTCVGYKLVIIRKKKFRLSLSLEKL